MLQLRNDSKIMKKQELLGCGRFSDKSLASCNAVKTSNSRHNNGTQWLTLEEAWLSWPSPMWVFRILFLQSSKLIIRITSARSENKETLRFFWASSQGLCFPSVGGSNPIWLLQVTHRPHRVHSENKTKNPVGRVGRSQIEWGRRV